MSREGAPRQPGLSRRGFLGLTSAAVGLWARRAWAGPPDDAAGGDPAPRSPFELEHRPVLRLPEATANREKVPVTVELARPMTAEHHTTRVEVVKERDPIASKGVFYFTPANGRVYVAFQARMDPGVSKVMATAECNRHGKFSTSRMINVRDGGADCSGMPTAVERARGDDIHPPVIRIAELVKYGRIRADEIIHAQVKMRHPNRTGMTTRDGKLLRESEPLYLKEMEVYYGGERVSRFEMTPALSEDPFITFSLLAQREGPLEVVLTNSQGRRFEAMHEIRLS